MQWTLEGRVWSVGDDVGIDTHIMTLRAVRERIFDAERLRDMIFEESFPEITAEARPGDIIVGGRRFAHGNPHINGWIGMKARGLGVVCSSIARGGFRNAINSGCPLLVGDTPLATVAQQGQGIRVDFESGRIELDTGEVFQVQPLAPELREIVALGGSAGWTKEQVRRRQLTNAGGA